MSKSLELRRHTDNDGDLLTPDGVRAAVEIGRHLESRYDLLVFSGAQRATQTLACLVAGLGYPVPGGAVVEPELRSEREDRWRELYREAGSADLAAMHPSTPRSSTRRPTDSAAHSAASWARCPPAVARWPSATVRPTRWRCSTSSVR